jgi:nucleotide-binding universal stress UspA family protein
VHAEVRVHPLALGGATVSAGDERRVDRHPEPEPVVTVDPDRPALVCTVDEDGLAPRIVETAAELAAKLGLRLTIVHSPAPDVFLRPEEHRAAVERGHALLDVVAARWPGARRSVQTGSAAELVRGVAAEGTALIVAGSRRRGPVTAALLGSVSQEIVRHASCPVVIVPEG